MKRILLTGGCGFIGHHTVEHILKKTDWEIIVLDRLDYASSGFDRLRDIEVFDNKRVKVYTWELEMPISENMARELGHFDYVVHMAAASHVDDSILMPRPFIENNIKSTITMLEFAKKAKPDLFIYFSTDEVYGTAPEGISYKEGARFNPGNPYAASKAAAECICMSYSNTYKIPIMITNTMNVIGERQHPQKYVPKIITHVLEGKVLPIHSNKEKTQAGKRHYIHARNVADGLLFILNNCKETLDNIDSSKGKFNIVGEKELDNLQLAQLVAKAVGKELVYEMVDFHSSRPGHDLRYALSGKKLEEIGWKPPMAIEESISRVVKWSLMDKNKRWLEMQ